MRVAGENNDRAPADPTVGINGMATLLVICALCIVLGTLRYMEGQELDYEPMYISLTSMFACLAFVLVHVTFKNGSPALRPWYNMTAVRMYTAVFVALTATSVVELFGFYDDTMSLSTWSIAGMAIVGIVSYATGGSKSLRQIAAENRAKIMQLPVPVITFANFEDMYQAKITVPIVDPVPAAIQNDKHKQLQAHSILQPAANGIAQILKQQYNQPTPSARSAPAVN